MSSIKGSVFSKHAFFNERARLAPYELKYMSGHHPATVQRAGRKIIDLRALRLWLSSRQWRAVPWSCIDAAPGCRALRRSSVNILTAWSGRVAQAPRAGRESARSLVLLTMLLFWKVFPCHGVRTF